MSLAGLSFIDPTRVGWERAWKALYEAYPGTEHPCPDTGEAWQYMGSIREGHQFRHRRLPSGERRYHIIPWADGDRTLVAPPPPAPTLWERLGADL